MSRREPKKDGSAFCFKVREPVLPWILPSIALQAGLRNAYPLPCLRCNAIRRRALCAIFLFVVAIVVLFVMTIFVAVVAVTVVLFKVLILVFFVLLVVLFAARPFALALVVVAFPRTFVIPAIASSATSGFGGTPAFSVPFTAWTKVAHEHAHAVFHVLAHSLVNFMTIYGSVIIGVGLGKEIVNPFV